MRGIRIIRSILVCAICFFVFITNALSDPEFPPVNPTPPAPTPPFQPPTVWIPQAPFVPRPIESFIPTWTSTIQPPPYEPKFSSAREEYKIIYPVTYGGGLSGIFMGGNGVWGMSIPRAFEIIYDITSWAPLPVITFDSSGTLHLGVRMGLPGVGLESTFDFGPKGLNQTVTLSIDIFVASGGVSITGPYESPFKNQVTGRLEAGKW